MPRYDVDRDKFIAAVDRRRRRASFLERLRKELGLSRRSAQAAVYDATFQSDAEAVSYSYALRNDHLPDMENPVWLNEKIRWQFLNHPNPLMTYVADKLAVRDYLAFKGARIRPARLLASGTDPADLLRMELPARFVLKSNHGSGQNLKVDGSASVSGQAMARRVAAWNGHDQWRRTGELHYRGIAKQWLMEELLPAGKENREYQINCIHGVPHHITVIVERVGSRFENIRQVVMDPSWQPVDFAFRGLPSQTAPEPRPEALDLMLAESRRLSADFMLVRVDFLKFGGRLTFSELTFADSAARVPYLPLERNFEIGARLDLSQAPDYAMRGERVLSEMAQKVAA